MSKSKDELELEKLVEIDGEYCVPHELNEARHVVDWGPFEPPRSAWYIVHKFLLFLAGDVPVHPRGADHEGGRGRDRTRTSKDSSRSRTASRPWASAGSAPTSCSPGRRSPRPRSPSSAPGTLTKLQTFTMLSGSRLGASFIVLLTGFLYAARNRHDPNRGEPIGMGIQAMTMTALVYLPGMMIGYAIIRSGLLDGLNLHASGELEAALSVIWGPVVDAIEMSFLPRSCSSSGSLVILASFKVLDLVLPRSRAIRPRNEPRGCDGPWTMFALGCIVATLTLSVSVALTVLIPLAVKGYVRRDEALPYIMGANITTLADTLVVAMLQRDPAAAQIVLAEAIGVTIVSLAILAFWYQPVKRGVIRLDDYFVGSTRRLAVFVAILFLLPVSFLLSGLWIGPIVQ